jgi:HK97 family phage portal protein
VNPIVRFFKQFRMEWAAGPKWIWWGRGRSQIDYRSEVGDGHNSSIVQACILWFCRNFPEAPVRVSTINRSGDIKPQPAHPLKLLLDTPNPFYSGELLWWGTLADWSFGNAYWLKIRSSAGIPVALWWIPSSMMEPRWSNDGSSFISYYGYTPNGEEIAIPIEDVVHFRYGLDPANPRKGLSPLGSLFREIYTDQEAASYAATMLRNVGVPPVVISPGAGVKPTQDEMDEVKQGYIAKTTGDRRGEPMVMRSETTIQVLGFNPQQMNLRDLRNIPEERVSAIFGIPAAVIGLGSGLINTKVGATMREMREQAIENVIVPSQRLFSSELRTQLLPDFGDPATLMIDFDLSQVRVLQEDQTALHTRALADLNGGAITLNEFREMIGLEPLPEGDVLYLPGTVTPTDPAELLAPPEPVTTITELLAPGDEAQSALPPGKHLSFVKQLQTGDDLALAIERFRANLEADAEKELTKFLRRQKGFVLSRLQDRKADRVPDVAELMIGEEDRLKDAIRLAVHLRALSGMQSITQSFLRLTLQLDGRDEADFLRNVGHNIRGIDQVTREAVRQALREGLANNETIAQIAGRLEQLPAFSPGRAKTIAQTEVAQATNTAAMFMYRASGRVVGVLVTDGDYDARCAAMNGQKFRLENAPASLEHPNCRRVILPITDLGEMEDVA